MTLLIPIMWIFSFILLMRKRNEMIYSPIVWLLLGWGFIYTLYLFSGIDYHYKLSVEVGLYFWGVFVAAFVGTRIANKYGLRLGKKKKRLIPDVDAINPHTFNLFFTLAIIGTTMAVLDIIRLNSISLSLHSSVNLSAISNVGILLSGLGLVLWLYECIYAVTNNTKFRWQAFICLLCYALPNMITAGRQSIIVLFVSSFIVLFYSFQKVGHYKYSYIITTIVVIGIVVVFLYTTLISASRTVVSNKIALFNYIYSSSLSPETERILDKLGPFKTVILEILYYYSHELSMLEIFWRFYDGPLFWGMSQLQLVSRNIPWGNGTIFDLMWDYLDSFSAFAGVYGHVWRSAVSNCILDFGKIGGMIYALVIGYSTQRLYKNTRKTKSVYKTVGLALVCAGMLFAIQYSPICDANWLYPFFWWLVLPFWEKMSVKKKL